MKAKDKILIGEEKEKVKFDLALGEGEEKGFFSSEIMNGEKRYKITEKGKELQEVATYKPANVLLMVKLCIMNGIKGVAQPSPIIAFKTVWENLSENAKINLNKDNFYNLVLGEIKNHPTRREFIAYLDEMGIGLF